MILTLSRLVAQVESGNNSTLVRYEPNWRYTTLDCLRKFHDAHRPGKMTDSTAKMLLSCSWGKYQLIGSNLYDLGFTEPLVTFAASPRLQETWFENFLLSRKIDYDLSEILEDATHRANFARKYNGDSRVYGARLLEVHQQFLKGKWYV